MPVRTVRWSVASVLKLLREFALVDAGKGRYVHDPETGRLVFRQSRKRTVDRASPAPSPNVPRRERPRCGARTRAGGACQARAVPGKARCRMHGGLSTGPKTPEGRAAIAESNRRRAGRPA